MMDVYIAYHADIPNVDKNLIDIEGNIAYNYYIIKKAIQ